MNPGIAPKLSYILTTKNKLPYLAYTLERLLVARKRDEEILIADAASKDGTREYLAKLLHEGKINSYISESDHGEAHALNKLLLRARGELITLITDDDAFYFPAKDACREFMIKHSEIDYLSTNGGFKDQSIKTKVRPLNYTNEYRAWMQCHTPFTFCGLGPFFRRSSLPLLGLWDPNFRWADGEYGFRVTAGRGNIAWYTAPSFVNISNPLSVSKVFQKKIHEEKKVLEQFYLGKTPSSKLMRLPEIFRAKIKFHLNKSLHQAPADYQANWLTLVSIADQWLAEQNKYGAEFLFKHSSYKA